VLAPFDELAALINCAGVIFRDGAEYNIETFQKVIDVNLTGTMRMCVGAHPKLAAARGAIVNTASMLSFFGGPLVPAYTASKGGVAQLTKALAVAWAAEGIRVNAIAPGWIATELTRSLVEDESRSAAILGRTPASVGASQETWAARRYFFVPKRPASSRERYCPSMADTQQYERRGQP
jgi:NAD(P)-dependent dehydrogenase (short-subunit alcohol dehydrogenase family)